MSTTTRFIVKVSAAAMPTSCKGRYVRVGVMEMLADAPFPSMLSSRSRGCVRVVETWERCNVGHTERCASRRAIAAAEALASSLNAQGGQSVAA
jgi:hypothetical protein